MTDITSAELERIAPAYLKGAARYQRELQELDTEYGALLEDAISGVIGLSEYDEWLRKTYLDACRMAQEVCYAWYNIIDCKMDIPEEERGARRPLTDVTFEDDPY